MKLAPSTSHSDDFGEDFRSGGGARRHEAWYENSHQCTASRGFHPSVTAQPAMSRAVKRRLGEAKRKAFHLPVVPHRGMDKLVTGIADGGAGAPHRHHGPED